MNAKDLLIVSTTALALVLAACSSDDDKNNDTGVALTPCAGGYGVINPSLTIDGKQVCDLSGVIDTNLTFDNSMIYRLTEYTYVGRGNVNVASAADVTAIQNAGVKLTIQAGVQFRSTGRGTLIVTRGSEIDIQGTAAEPVMMTSQDDGFEGRGEWGGLVLQGFGQNNQCGTVTPAICNTADEAGTGIHGGDIEADSSGSITYLIVAEGGYEVAPDEEINGITFHSVGSGTTLENIMVHNNSDDGVEFFGGTANIKHLILTDNGDESIDWDDGYQGNIQFALIRQAITGTSDHGIEADSEGANNAPFAYPTVANATFQLVNAANGDDLFRFKKGTGVNLVNIAADGYTECFKIGDATTGQNVTAAGAPLRVTNVAVDSCSGSLASIEDGADANFASDGSDLFRDGAGVTVDAATLVDTSVTLDSVYAVSAGGPVIAAPVDVDANTELNGTFLTDTDYIGAVEPGTLAANVWYKWAKDVIPAAF